MIHYPCYLYGVPAGTPSCLYVRVYLAADPCSTAYLNCSATFWLHTKCCKATIFIFEQQPDTAARYCNCQCAAGSIPMLSYFTAVLNTWVVQCLFSVQKVPGLIPGQVCFFFTDCLLQAHHHLSAAFATRITCCKCRIHICHLCRLFPHVQSAFLQCSISQTYIIDQLCCAC